MYLERKTKKDIVLIDKCQTANKVRQENEWQLFSDAHVTMESCFCGRQAYLIHTNNTKKLIIMILRN